MSNEQVFTKDTLVRNEFETKLSNLTINKTVQSEVAKMIEDLEQYHIDKSKKGKDKKNKVKDKETDEITTKEQGDMLENIIRKIIDNISILKCVQNERISSHEIDFLVKFNTLGRVLKKEGYIPEWFPEKFLIECKNYVDTTVGITYTGKFRSLMEVTSVKLGLLVSYNGLAGKDSLGWKDATGYVRKLALINPKENEKTIILDIDINCLRKLINEMPNIFELIDDERDKLITDVKSDFSICYKHESEDKFIDR